MIDKFMISCESAAKLTSKNHDDRLGVYERIKLLFHLQMCKICNIYKKQQDWIHEVLGKKGDLKFDEEQSEKLKNCIIDKVHESRD